VWGKKGKLVSSPVVWTSFWIEKQPWTTDTVFLMVFINILCGSCIVISWIASDPFGLDKYPVHLPKKQRCSQQFRYFFLCLFPFLPSVPTEFSVYLFFLHTSVGLLGKFEKKTLLQLSILLSNVVRRMTAKASFTYKTADQSVGGWGKKSKSKQKKIVTKKEKVKETENIMKAYRLPKQ